MPSNRVKLNQSEEVRGCFIVSSLDKTMYFDFGANQPKDVHDTLVTVYQTLEEKGYNPINQIVGYLLSGDPAYIPRINDARNLIRKHERDEIIEELVRVYLNQNGSVKKS
ncbi:hypothetical protein UCCLBBS449_0905 [Levilactobacillus brevis]|uniref:UPF0297 protein UCCLBBS449_0905 n=1 Tax=Levilactobacillus brevis TaxID=1580 RepID=A0A5B7XYU7_LEVBR|nr:hypothetical protein UCCLBBS449_0905 [Levilactobacillus brevis]